MEISNVLFKEAVNFHGDPKKNFKPGDKNGKVTEIDIGILIEIPTSDRIEAYAVKVPYGLIKQITYKV